MNVSSREERRPGQPFDHHNDRFRPPERTAVATVLRSLAQTVRCPRRLVALFAAGDFLRPSSPCAVQVSAPPTWPLVLSQYGAIGDKPYISALKHRRICDLGGAKPGQKRELYSRQSAALPPALEVDDGLHRTPVRAASKFCSTSRQAWQVGSVSSPIKPTASVGRRSTDRRARTDTQLRIGR
jgi:hypothetical protein